MLAGLIFRPLEEPIQLTKQKFVKKYTKYDFTNIVHNLTIDSLDHISIFYDTFHMCNNLHLCNNFLSCVKIITIFFAEGGGVGVYICTCVKKHSVVQVEIYLYFMTNIVHFTRIDTLDHIYLLSI